MNFTDVSGLNFFDCICSGKNFELSCSQCTYLSSQSSSHIDLVSETDSVVDLASMSDSEEELIGTQRPTQLDSQEIEFDLEDLLLAGDNSPERSEEESVEEMEEEHVGEPQVKDGFNEPADEPPPRVFFLNSSFFVEFSMVC